MASLVREIPFNAPLLRALSCQMLALRAGPTHPSVQVLWRFQQLAALRYGRVYGEPWSWDLAQIESTLEAPHG